MAFISWLLQEERDETMTTNPYFHRCSVPVTPNVVALFDSIEETLVLSCLEGTMGAVYSNAAETAAASLLGAFCFFAGTPDDAVIRGIDAVCSSDFLILVPPDGLWAARIVSCFGNRTVRGTRYAIKKEGISVFDQAQLQKAVAALPAEYSLSEIDETLYPVCLSAEFSRDFVGLFADAADFAARGLGVVCLHEGTVVAGASSYSVYRGGIEIEIDTREDYRRRGLAYSCAAALILRCIARGLYPSWDAANLMSVSLAEKLGYHMDAPYPVYFLTKGGAPI